MARPTPTRSMTVNRNSKCNRSSKRQMIPGIKLSPGQKLNTMSGKISMPTKMRMLHRASMCQPFGVITPHSPQKSGPVGRSEPLNRPHSSNLFSDISIMKAWVAYLENLSISWPISFIKRRMMKRNRINRTKRANNSNSPSKPAQNPVAAFRDQLAAGVHKAYDIAQNAKDTTGAAVDQYNKQVAANKKTPFFNNTDNTPMQWLGKVAADAKKRGPFEAAQDLTYPILENPYIEPVTEPITGAVRMANYKAGRPIPLINAALGQTDADYGIKSPKSLFNYQGTDTPPTNPNNPPISQQSIDQIKNVKLPLINRPVNTQ